MKASFLLVLTSLINVYCYSQTLDTASGALAARSYRSEKWRIASRENVAFKTHNIPMSPIEIEIMDLESRECIAVKKRDTITLVRLWARDFTQDKKQNELVNNKHGLPNYLSLKRMIETFYAIDNNTVFTSGYESFQEIKNDWKLEPLAKRKYSHTWTRKNGLWKLTTKITH